jgi:hypothetical protein
VKQLVISFVSRIDFFFDPGWHHSIWEYRGKIKGILVEMFYGEHVLDANRTIVDLYLDNPIFQRIELLLNSIQRPGGEIDTTSGLHQKFVSYVQTEEARMAEILESISYEIDALNTLTLITDGGRIERVCLNLLDYVTIS